MRDEGECQMSDVGCGMWEVGECAGTGGGGCGVYLQSFVLMECDLADPYGCRARMNAGRTGVRRGRDGFQTRGMDG